MSASRIISICTKLTLILLVRMALPCILYAQQTTAYQAFICQDITAWKSLIDSLRTIPTPTLGQCEQLVNLEYGYVAWGLSLSDSNRGNAETYLKHGYHDLAAYEQAGGAKARIGAYRSAFYAYDMKLHSHKTIRFGIKCISEAKTARRADSNDYMAQIQYGNIMYYMPRILGGSPDEALKAYLKAKSILERQNRIHHNWLYMNLLLTIADIYKSQGNYQTVQTYYDLILTLEPNYPWVRDELVPANQARIK